MRQQQQTTEEGSQGSRHIEPQVLYVFFFHIFYITNYNLQGIYMTTAENDQTRNVVLVE